MRITLKQLKFSFPLALFYAMIPSVILLSSGNCFALERLPPFSYYDVIEHRNIFRPKEENGDVSQKQKPAPVASLEYAASGLDQYVLTGIVKLRGKYKATITGKTSGNGHYVSAGDMIDDIKVIDINGSRAVLEKDGETYELKINTNASYQGSEKDNTAKEKNTQTQKEPASDSNLKRQTNIMKSIRMGTPNVQRQ